MRRRAVIGVRDIAVERRLAHAQRERAARLVEAVANRIALAPDQPGDARLERALAFVEADGNLSIAALIAAQASQLPQGSSAILITPNASPELLFAVDDLQRRYMRPMVVIFSTLIILPKDCKSNGAVSNFV